MVSIHSSVLFSWLTFIYPANLYIFERLFSKSQIHQSKAKILSIIASCLQFLAILRPSFSFQVSGKAFGWIATSLAPFLLPLLFNEKSEPANLGNFLFWRNILIAPACEELYYRILLAQYCSYNLILSMAFSLAHAHPIIFTPYVHDLNEIIGQCLISFLFGLVSNALRAKMAFESGAVVNLWIWFGLTAFHGVANYCGLPILFDSPFKFLKIIQIGILIFCAVKIIF